jgi:transglutaminase-like putative cysteine protease
MQLLSALCLLGLLPASEPAREIVPLEEYHEVAHLDGLRVGHAHTRVVRGSIPDTFHTTSTLVLDVKRYGSIVRLQMSQSTLEDRAGSVLALSFRQGSQGGRPHAVSGKREGNTLILRNEQTKAERRLPCSDAVLGLRQQEKLLASQELDRLNGLRFSRYEPLYNAVVSVRVQVGEPELVDVLGQKQLLRRVELRPEPLQAGTQHIVPAASIVWLDSDRVPVRRQIELDGLGTLILTRTNRSQATAVVQPSADLGSRSLIPLNRTIQQPYTTRSALYRIRVSQGQSPYGLLCSDAHQQVRRIEGQQFELAVHPVRPGTSQALRATEKASMSEPGAEYLANCFYIDHENERIVELARQAVGRQQDSWRKALLIERFVKNRLRNDNQIDLMPASQIARELRGDCRHHALLVTALCRAAGIPARTALGLLYVQRGGPHLGFHLWAEVFVDGTWVGLDSTLGLGGVSATHLKINDSSWQGVTSLLPLHAATRILRQLHVEVLNCS